MIFGNIIKYDLLKYCYNLKKIGEDFINVIFIFNFIWELEGGNDFMSKKRRGEFFDFYSFFKKMIIVRKDESFIVFLVVRLRFSRVMESLFLI